VFGVSFKDKGDFSNILKFLGKLEEEDYLKVLDSLGQKGVDALAAATPKDSGATAASWYYEIERGDGSTRIVWRNSNLAHGWFPVAIMLQYGHGTGTGGYVEGRDYINPAIRPIFDEIATTAWEAIVSS
jgi:hypothetical protein